MYIHKQMQRVSRLVLLLTQQKRIEKVKLKTTNNLSNAISYQIRPYHNIYINHT